MSKSFSTVTTDAINSYRQQGVVCLRQVIDEHWLDTCRRGVTRSIANPGPFFRDYTAEDSPSRYLFDYWIWQAVPELQQFSFESNLAEIIADLLPTDRLTLLMDQWFQREAGSTNAAVWHHDEPYFDFFGGQKCILWFPLETASSDEGLTLIGGSHRWDKLFMAQNFGEKKPFAGDMSDYCEIGDMDQHRDRYLSWNMEPGDCLVFDFRTVHRATSHDRVCERTLHRMSYRYGDAEVKFRPRGEWTAEISQHLLSLGQQPDAPVDCALCPVVFDRLEQPAATGSVIS